MFQKVTFAVRICEKLNRLLAYGEKKNAYWFIYFGTAGPGFLICTTNQQRTQTWNSAVIASKNCVLHPYLKSLEHTAKRRNSRSQPDQPAVRSAEPHRKAELRAVQQSRRHEPSLANDEQQL